MALGRWLGGSLPIMLSSPIVSGMRLKLRGGFAAVGLIEIYPAWMKAAMASNAEPQGPDFEQAGGILPAIAQDADTGQVLMLAYMNAESFHETLASGRAVYYSRRRGRLWRKGEESGHWQEVVGVFIDCDRDTILLRVRQVGGAACHQGYASCFFRQVTPQGLEVVAERVFDPAQVYGQRKVLPGTGGSSD